METKSRKRRNGGDGAPINEDHLMGKEVMYQAAMAIEERKRQLNMANNRQAPVITVKTPPISSHAAKLNQAEASVFMASQIDKREEKLNEIKARIAANQALANLKKLPMPGGMPLKKDSIPLEKEVPAAPAPKVVEQKPAVYEKFEYKPFLDPRLKVRSAVRERRTNFSFHEKGEFEALANKQRQNARLEKLQSKISDAAKSTGISSAVRLAMVTPAIQDTAAKEIPQIEWWDEIVLDGSGYESMPSTTEPISKRYVTTITDLIEHPVQLKAPNEASTQQCLKTHLTKKEMKKIRRQNRKENLKEKQEKVRLGLEKPPEAKVKMSNLMRVLGNDAIQDPTKMEEHVKKQVAERLRKHHQENEDRKLTKEERAAKKTKKISEDTSSGVHVAVYKTKSLSHPAKKFKVERNAKQLQMTGVIIYHKLINVVVVEGGPKQQKFYKNLMMNRIKWADEIIGQKKDVEDREVPGERNECHLVWEGVVKKRAFQELRSVTAESDRQARELLDKHGVANYWDLSYSTTILNPDQDDHVEE